ncbi:MAG: hypothetical protein WAU99_14790, partial [Pseudolabrys sp.]
MIGGNHRALRRNGIAVAASHSQISAAPHEKSSSPQGKIKAGSRTAVGPPAIDRPSNSTIHLRNQQMSSNSHRL